MTELVPVTSSNIDSIGYDPDKNELHVCFRNGAYYIYPDVSPDQHAALMAAKSIGSHFHAHVKSSVKGRKVTAEQSVASSMNKA